MKFKKQEIFSIRKCKVCVASIVIGLGFGMASGVSAQEVGEISPSNEPSVEQPAGTTGLEVLESLPTDTDTENPVESVDLQPVEEPIIAETVGETRQASDTVSETTDEASLEVPATTAPEGYTAEEKLSLIKAISLDGGRKYFSPDQLKAVIDTASQKGFTDFHLLLGNDGLRFILDDMSLTVNDRTYSSEEVKRAIENGNRAYYDDPNGNYLTQAEMDDLITYAKDRYMNLIPAINSPGHMDAILESMKELGIENPAFSYRNKASARTVDLNNQEAVDFTKALIEKYAAYFSGKTDIFNIGLDEYANDVSKTSGFRLLKLQGQYPKFIQYANDLAAIVKKYNMSPMAFNDGIYYESDDQSGTFDKDLIVSYWTGGWQGYSVASSKFLADKGHAILNTNDAWYYVIGRDNKNSGWYNLDQGLDGIGKVPLTHVQKNEDSDIPIVGSMMAIWADKPELTYRKELLDRMMNKLVEKNADFFRANYQPILREIKKVPEDLTTYPKEAVDAYKAAFEAINWELSQADTAQIQSMYTRLREARIALTGPDAEEEVLPTETPLNQSALEELLARFDQLDTSKLTEEERNELQTALAAVEPIVASGNQEELDQLVSELEFMLELLTPSAGGSSETTPEPNESEVTPSPAVGSSEPGSTTSDEVTSTDPLQALVAQFDQLDLTTLTESEREEVERLTDAVLLAVDAGVQEQIDAAVAQVQAWFAARTPGASSTGQPSSPAPVSPSTQPTAPSPAVGSSDPGSTSADEVAATDPLQTLVAQLEQIDTATLSEAEREELEGLTDAVLLAVDAGVQEQIDAAIAQVQAWLAARSTGEGATSQPSNPAPVSPSTQPTSPSPSVGTGETGSPSSDEVAAIDPLQALVAQLEQIDTATLSEAEREALEGLTDAVLLAVDAGVQEQIDAAIAQVQAWLAARSTGEGATSQPSNPAPASPSTQPAAPSPSAGTGETGSPSSAPVSQPASTVESKQEEELSSSVKPISTQPTAPNPTAGTGETGSPSSAPVSQPASTVESKQEEELSSSVKPISTEGEQGDVQAGQTETSSETDKALEEESVSNVNSEATEVVTKEEELITFVPAYAPQMAALPEGHLPEIVFAKGESTQAPSLPTLELPSEDSVITGVLQEVSPTPNPQSVVSLSVGSQSASKEVITTAKALPQTGQNSNQEWLLLGGLIGLLGFAKLRKKEDI